MEKVFCFVFFARRNLITIIYWDLNNIFHYWHCHIWTLIASIEVVVVVFIYHQIKRNKLNHLMLKWVSKESVCLVFFIALIPVLRYTITYFLNDTYKSKYHRKQSNVILVAIRATYQKVWIKKDIRERKLP